MSAFRIQNQCLFLAIYACCILLCASIMSSVQNGADDAVGTTQTDRFVCTSCERHNLPAFYASLRACSFHMGHCKQCRGAPWKKVTIMTRPGDVIAGGSGGMGPCPEPQQQPPGICKIYTWHIPII